MAELSQLFQLMIENIRDSAIFMLDANGNVASWNVGAQNMTGWTEREIVGQPVTILYTDEDRQAGRPAATLRDARRDGSHRSEGWRVRRDGSRFWAEESVDSLGEDGRDVGFVQVVRDVTERQQLLNELRLAVRARDQFLTIASHELKTPLTALELQVQLLHRSLARGVLDPEKLRAQLAVVMRSSERLTELINTLLDVTRIGAGKMELQREDVELVALAEASVVGQHPALERAGSTVTLRASGPITGRWDRLRIAMVVDNLLANAIKYGEGKPIEIEVAAREDHAQLSVRDHGIGIPTDQQARIFDRFERAVPERHYGGFGLGLWITRQIIDAHGGRIHVESTSGQGSTFTIELPLAGASVQVDPR